MQQRSKGRDTNLGEHSRWPLAFIYGTPKLTYHIRELINKATNMPCVPLPKLEIYFDHNKQCHMIPLALWREDRLPWKPYCCSKPAANIWSIHSVQLNIPKGPLILLHWYYVSRECHMYSVAVWAVCSSGSGVVLSELEGWWLSMPPCV